MENAKKWPRSQVEAGKLANLFLIFPTRPKAWTKAFHSYSFIKLSRIEVFRPFLVNFIIRLLLETMTVKNFKLQFSLYVPKFYDGRKFHHQGNLSTIDIFTFFVSDHIKIHKLNEFFCCWSGKFKFAQNFESLTMHKYISNTLPNIMFTLHNTVKLLSIQVIPGHRNTQKRRTIFIDYLFKYCHLYYQNFSNI